MLERRENARKFDDRTRRSNATSNATENIGNERTRRRRGIAGIWQCLLAAFLLGTPVPR